MASKKTANNLSSETLSNLDAAFEQVIQKEVAKRPLNSFTATEYREKTGLPKTTAYARLRILLKAGRIKEAKIPVINASGALRLVEGYQVVDSPAA